MRRLLDIGLLLACVASLGLAACGQKSSGHGATPARQSKIEAAFAKASKEHGIPVRFLMAVGYLESRLAPENATAHYVSLTQDEDPAPRGTVMTETAFGLTHATLGLDPAAESAKQLDAQVDAYARWLSENVKDLKLAAQPKTQEEKFRWVEALSSLHRRGLAQRRNVQILFARELIQTLNHGFVWQDPNDADGIVRLEEETPAIAPSELPADGKNWFNLDTLAGQFYGVTYLPLVTVPSDEFENKPRRVEVIHCPLSLSACLELQTRSEESDVHLAAHYVIPQLSANKDDNIFDGVLQVADQQEAVVLTNKRGESYPVEDAIVVMLVGNPGRIVAGQRYPAIPTWFSDQQLRSLGRIVNDVCTLLAQRSPDIVNRDTCMAPAGDLGVQFRTQGESEEYRWGDIADFDPTIFQAYLRSPDGLGTEVAFEFAKDWRIFDQGQTIPLTVRFNASAKTVELERLSRCQNGKVVWEPVRIQQVRGQTTAYFEELLHDGGPNRNGDQFYRVRVYGKDSKLIGWSIDRIYLRTYEPELAWASEGHCGVE